MTAKQTPTILVIVGITGDLAKRKLIPALAHLAHAGALPEKFFILGTTRQAHVDHETLFADVEHGELLTESFALVSMDMQEAHGYARLKAQLTSIEAGWGIAAKHVVYLSVPAEAALTIVTHLGASGMVTQENTLLLLEKPFGKDYASAMRLITEIERYFTPEQVYRIDHYLAKEMAQNVIVFRESNSLFRRTWNNAFIERIDIVASESIGIEGRGNFYEQTGALRDIVQSHLLQLAALTLLDITSDTTLPERRFRALETLHVVPGSVIRGQYEGYREIVGVPESMTETYVSLRLESTDLRWIGVPITLTTGKKLDTKATDIRIYYKRDSDMESNELIVRLQPNEGIQIAIWSKRPGYEHAIEKKLLDLRYADQHVPEAYEQVLLDAMGSDPRLFISDHEVLESWRIVAPIQEAWHHAVDDLKLYEPGSAPADII